MKRAAIPVTLLLASFAIASADPHRATTDSRGVTEAIAQAPAKYRDRQNPYQGQGDAVAAGAKLFRQHCAECHSNDGHGIGNAANLHGLAVQNATPGQLEWLLRNGNLGKGMPSWSGIPEQRRWQIVAYVKSLGEQPSTSQARNSRDKGYFATRRLNSRLRQSARTTQPHLSAFLIALTEDYH